MKRLSSESFVVALLLAAAPIAAQVTGSAGDFNSVDTLDPVLAVKVSHTTAANTIAVYGISAPQPNYGLGAYFLGGTVGVDAKANLAGVGSRIGLYGESGYGSGENYGVQGAAYSPENGSTAYGVVGGASCTGVGCVSYAGYFNGDLAYTGSLVNASDQMLKKDVVELDTALDELLALHVVRYEYKHGAEVGWMNLPTGPQVGFVAQQVAEVAPELVADVVDAGAGAPGPSDPGARPSPGPPQVESEPIRYKGIKTMEMVPLLVRAIQEQQAEIEALKAEIAPLQRRLADLERGRDAAGAVTTAAYAVP